MSPSNPKPKPNQPPGNLNVKKFAESRSRELESLHAVISDRLNHDFKIPRRKRRRTTGYRTSKHKIRKVSVSGASSDSGLKTSRRVRRRLELRSNPELGFVRSGDGTRRLRTHLWHAKRFEMVKRWGFYLPLGVQGRCV